jgi:hypothetical protein
VRFKEYVAKCKVKADAAGDVLRLAKQDPGLPEIATVRELQAYLEGRGLPESVTRSANEAWERYRTSSAKAGGA